jgi:hypothetical protein
VSATADRDAVIAALRADPGRDWDARGLSAATGVPFMRVRSAITALRFSGKVTFDRIALSPSMLAEDETVAVDAPEPEPSAMIDAPEVAGEPVWTGFDMGAPGSEAAKTVAVIGGIAAALTPQPSGPGLLAELDAFTASTGLTRSDFCRASGFTWATLNSLQRSARPHAATVHRFRRALAEMREKGAPPPVKPGERKVAVSRHEPVTRPGVAIEERRARDAAAEAERLAEVRAAGLCSPASRAVVEAVTSAFAETAAEAMAAVDRRWPELWARVLASARAEGVRPGVRFVELLAAGLDGVGEGT